MAERVWMGMRGRTPAGRAFTRRARMQSGGHRAEADDPPVVVMVIPDPVMSSHGDQQDARDSD